MSTELLNETKQIKQLLMLLLVKLGSTSDEIAIALGVSPRTVRNMMPASKIKKLDVG